jgi:hypothetical protein
VCQFACPFSVSFYFNVMFFAGQPAWEFYFLDFIIRTWLTHELVRWERQWRHSRNLLTAVACYNGSNRY